MSIPHIVVQKGQRVALLLLSCLIAICAFSLLLLTLPASANNGQTLSKKSADSGDPVITAVTPLSAVAGEPFTLSITATNVISVSDVQLNSLPLTFVTSDTEENTV